ncbi:MAG TPA: putative sugar nucleotidyl transferase [Flavisolibacter sp.]|jgi:UDP-N-acetylglucosamine diphosphorylase/glucosamine-1-phosphate N-acetyltransferase|nr:putative sugar nucleotidyl transferase [Flavisolibacter sp.]
MKKIVFTEEFCQPENLFPFTLTRQVQDIRCGILTLREKWEQFLELSSYDQFEQDYKDQDRSIEIYKEIGKDTLYLIHGNLLPTEKLVKAVKKLKPGEFLTRDGTESLVYCISSKEVAEPNRIKMHRAIEWKHSVDEIRYPWDLFQLNGAAIKNDYSLLTAGRKSQKVSSSNRTSGKDLFLETGVKMEHCILNSEEGPIYIGKNATVMEGTLLRGPVSIGEGAVIKMGTKLYGGTTIGPYCLAGGEIKNSILFNHSNKAHDGYLGDSVIGAWCNMGAGTSNSNIKNTASAVLIHTLKGAKSAGTKCGVFMGDYSRTAINTSINTGTVIGACSNVFGNGLTPKYIPSFSWGSDGVQRYTLDKAFADIANWKQLKQQTLTENEKTILKHIFDHY